MNILLSPCEMENRTKTAIIFEMTGWVGESQCGDTLYPEHGLGLYYYVLSTLVVSLIFLYDMGLFFCLVFFHNFLLNMNGNFSFPDTTQIFMLRF